MRTIAITNRKGGSGKTTAAVSLAAALGEMGEHVLVVDLDPQASASHWLGIGDGGTSLRDTLLNQGAIADIAEGTSTRGVSVVPASEWLVDLEAGLTGTEVSRTALRDSLRKSKRAGWSYVLFDCPPSLGVLSILALTAAKEVLVPVEASALALEGIPPLLRVVETVAKKLNRGLRVDHLLPCRVDRRKTLHRDVVENLREHFGERVMRSIIREGVRLQEAPSRSLPVTAYAPRSAAAADFRAAAKELQARGRN